jgi:hypothetical protein
MASGMRTGRSSNRIALQVGRGKEWWPGLENWMTPDGSEFFTLPKKQSSLLRSDQHGETLRCESDKV